MLTTKLGILMLIPSFLYALTMSLGVAEAIYQFTNSLRYQMLDGEVRRVQEDAPVYHLFYILFMAGMITFISFPFVCKLVLNVEPGKLIIGIAQ